jgi:hypothetical protein
MNRLSPDFELDRYGIQIRLVCESDAPFVTELRSSQDLAQYLHLADGDVEKQRRWIEEYKKREAEGKEYYFVYFKDGQPFGLHRLYNIDWTHLSFTSGSWICKKGMPNGLCLTAAVIVMEIAYDNLGLLIEFIDVRKENENIVRLHRDVFRAIEYGETELDYLFLTTPESRKNSRLKRFLGLPANGIPV